MGWRHASTTLATALALALLACNGQVTEPTGDRPPTDPTDPTDPTRPDPYEPPNPNFLPQDELFVCDGAPTSSPSRLRRIGRAEWVRNQGGAGDGNGSQNPFDPRLADQYSSYASNETIDLAMLELYMDLVKLPGGGWTAVWPDDRSRRSLLLANDDMLQEMLGADPSPEAVRYFCATYLERGALFREPTAYEVDHLVEFANGILAGEASVDERPESIKRITAAAWMTSGALFRAEMGDEMVDADGRHRLTNWELAQQLAYAIGGRAPGAAAHHRWPDYSADQNGHYADIAAAARDGSIQNTATIEALFLANGGGIDAGNVDMGVDPDADDYDPGRFDLMADFDSRRRARRAEYWVPAGVAQFFRDWLGYGDLSAVFKDTPEATSRYEGMGLQIGSGFGNLLHGYYGHESRLTEQLDDAIARIVIADQQVLRELLTTRTFYAAATLPEGVTRPATVDEYSDYFGANVGSTWKSLVETHRVYGIDRDVYPTRESRWIEVPATERAGVLTHPAWLISHGGNFEDDPSAVHRGKWIRENLLCQPVPDLSMVMVDARVGPSAPDKTARDRLSEATAGAECQGCHQLMNPLGFPFEIYNHAGFYRADDHGRPPDGSSTLSDMPDPSLNGPVRDAVDLSERFAESDWVERCFIRQAFRYFMGRPETIADACTLAAMETAYDDNDGSLNAMLSALFTSDTFLYRHHEMEAE